MSYRACVRSGPRDKSNRKTAARARAPKSPVANAPGLIALSRTLEAKSAAPACDWSISRSLRPISFSFLPPAAAYFYSLSLHCRPLPGYVEPPPSPLPSPGAFYYFVNVLRSADNARFPLIYDPIQIYITYINNFFPAVCFSD